MTARASALVIMERCTLWFKTCFVASFLRNLLFRPELEAALECTEDRKKDAKPKSTEQATNLKERIFF